MVLQVSPHIRAIQNRLDTQALEVIRRPDPRKHQKLGRVDDTPGQDHLPVRERRGLMASLNIMHPNSPLSLKHDLPGQRAGFDRQIRARKSRSKIRGRRAPAPRIADRKLVAPETFLFGSVEIRVGRIAGLDTGSHKRIEQIVVMACIADNQRSIAPMERISPAGIAFGAFEIGQHIRKGPARHTLLTPEVVIARMAADINHAVQRGRAPQRLAPGPEDSTIIQIGLGFGLVFPVVFRFRDDFRVADRNMDQGMGVARAGFQQQDSDGGISAQTVRQNTARTSRANDDKIVI